MKKAAAMPKMKLIKPLVTSIKLVYTKLIEDLVSTRNKNQNNNSHGRFERDGSLQIEAKKSWNHHLTLGASTPTLSWC